MARATRIYFVCPKDSDEIYATFTVKREAHEWVDRSRHDFEDLRLQSMQDNPRGETHSDLRTDLEWDYETIEWLMNRRLQTRLKAIKKK